MGCNQSQSGLINQALSERDKFKKQEAEATIKASKYEGELLILKKQLDFEKSESIKILTKKEESEKKLLAIENQNFELEKQLLKLKTELNEFQSQNQKFLNELEDYRRFKLSTATKTVIRYYKYWRQLNFNWAIEQWRDIPAILEENDFNSDDLNITEDSTISTLSQEDYKEAALDFIQKDYQNKLLYSTLMKEYNLHKVPIQKSMSITALYRSCETMMDKKYENDVNDLAGRRKPVDIGSYMIDYLIRHFGIKKLAYKTLSELIPALQHYCKEHNHYSIIMCRLLHIFHSEPISLSLGIFITKMRVEFNNLSKNAGLSKSSKKLLGGDAFIIDLFGLINNIFDTNKEVRTAILSLLKPEHVNKEDFFLFHLCNKIVRQAMTPDGAFDALSNLTDLPETSIFFSNIKAILDVKVFLDDEKIFRSIFDPKNLGFISKENFIGKINFQSYYNNCKNNDYVISRCKFLTTLLEVYNVYYCKAVSNLIKIYNQGNTNLNQQEYEQSALKAEPSLNRDQLDRLYEEALSLQNNEGFITCNSFTTSLTNYGIGHRGIKEFGKFYIAIPELWNISEKLKSDVSYLFLEESASSLSLEKSIKDTNKKD